MASAVDDQPQRKMSAAMPAAVRFEAEGASFGRDKPGLRGCPLGPPEPPTVAAVAVTALHYEQPFRLAAAGVADRRQSDRELRNGRRDERGCQRLHGADLTPDAVALACSHQAIRGARDPAVGAVRRDLGTSIDARAGCCFDHSASTRLQAPDARLWRKGRRAAGVAADSPSCLRAYPAPARISPCISGAYDRRLAADLGLSEVKRQTSSPRRLVCRSLAFQFRGVELNRHRCDLAGATIEEQHPMLTSGACAAVSDDPTDGPQVGVFVPAAAVGDAAGCDADHKHLDGV